VITLAEIEELEKDMECHQLERGLRKKEKELSELSYKWHAAYRDWLILKNRHNELIGKVVA